MQLGEPRPPTWARFQMLGVRDIVPYLTVFKCHDELCFTVEFMGPAVAAVLGEDMTGAEFRASTPTVAEIDLFERCLDAIERRNVNTVAGTANPQYTSKLEYISADFPFPDDRGAEVSYVVALTVGRTN